MSKRYLSFSLRVIVIIFVLSVLSCQKKVNETPEDKKLNEMLPQKSQITAQNVEKITIEQAIINCLDKLDIPPKNVKKSTKEDAIYFYIPLEQDKNHDLEFADMYLNGQIESTGTQMVNTIIEEETKIVREYFDAVHNQHYIIEMYYNHVDPGYNQTHHKPQNNPA